MARRKKPHADEPTAPLPLGDTRSTIGGASQPPDLHDVADDLASKFTGTGALVSSIPANPNTPGEYGLDAALDPEPGACIEPADPFVTASTVTERIASDKVGSGAPPLGRNRTIAPLDRVRADASRQSLTTNQGVPVADNQHSRKAGLRGPSLLDDFVLREQITHFDHERIPERIVHARGSAAHGFFECYESLEPHTRAARFSEAGRQTPVFVRCSTVLGERGSTDTARDVRGFAVKFYTEEGNGGLVGSNIPGHWRSTGISRGTSIRHGCR